MLVDTLLLTKLKTYKLRFIMNVTSGATITTTAHSNYIFRYLNSFTARGRGSEHCRGRNKVFPLDTFLVMIVCIGNYLVLKMTFFFKFFPMVPLWNLYSPFGTSKEARQFGQSVTLAKMSLTKMSLWPKCHCPK